MNNNELSTSSGHALAQYFNEGKEITELEINYNNFNGYDILEFCTFLITSDKLVSVDLAWNRIGSNEKCVLAIAEVFMKNKTLRILDISHNQIKDKNAQILIDALKDNHDLIELRITGNEMRMDIDGNLLKPMNVFKDTYSLLRTQTFNTAKDVNQQINKNLLRFHWSTEKWFKYDVELKGLKPTRPNLKEGQDFKLNNYETIFKNTEVTSPVFIHWEFDHWQPWYIEEKDKTWKTSFMIPTGNWRFFFTSNLSNALVSSEHSL